MKKIFYSLAMLSIATTGFSFNSNSITSSELNMAKLSCKNAGGFPSYDNLSTQINGSLSIISGHWMCDFYIDPITHKPSAHPTLHDDTTLTSFGLMAFYGKDSNMASSAYREAKPVELHGSNPYVKAENYCKDIGGTTFQGQTGYDNYLFEKNNPNNDPALIAQSNFCTFPDGSMLDIWGLYYKAFGDDNPITSSYLVSTIQNTALPTWKI